MNPRAEIDIDHFVEAVLAGQIVAQPDFVRHLEGDMNAGVTHIAIDDNRPLSGARRERRDG